MIKQTSQGGGLKLGVCTRLCGMGVPEDGYTYEQREIESHFASGSTKSPVDGDVLSSLTLIPNRNLKTEIGRKMLALGISWGGDPPARTGSAGGSHGGSGDGSGGGGSSGGGGGGSNEFLQPPPKRLRTFVG